MTAPKPVLVAIVGPTAVGKTALALELAHRFPLEVVSADSRQVYRGMDIGTAKPTQAERTAVPHHVIDVVEPDEPYTLAGYRRDALAAIVAVQQRRRLPVLVGGTGLYYRAVTSGMQIPEVAPDPAYRATLEAQVIAEGYEALHRVLAARDATAATAIDPRNVRRVIRALEVQHVTGRAFSQQAEPVAPPFHFITLGLSLDRAILYRRIDQRVDAMMAAGLLDEVERLHARGYGWSLPSMSGIGYRQLGEHLRGERTLGEAIDRIKLDSHAYVRRQYTWFRKEPGIEWHDSAALQAALGDLSHRIESLFA
ncbi:MAG: tRNA (adenosine(37)-N6)-dimethylallyltransferase MiaA [Dehalococcoidia bacterium]|nr:tRNA (adenosine(37)-N6)-dimethylallyltransferase MiaA [Dehalococcoidia bacterium]